MSMRREDKRRPQKDTKQDSKTSPSDFMDYVYGRQVVAPFDFQKVIVSKHG